MKRLIALVLSAALLFSTIPTVLFAPGSVYTDKEAFTIETLPQDKFVTLSADVPTNDLMATFSGIRNGVSRVVRAYVTSNGANIYSNFVDRHEFN